MSEQEKNIALYVVLSIVTCGIFAIYWEYQIGSSLYKHNNMEDKAGLDVVLSLVTCGIYFIYLQYKWGKMVDSARQGYGLSPKDDSVLYLILALFGLGLVNYCLVQSQINNELNPAAGNNPVQ